MSASVSARGTAAASRTLVPSGATCDHSHQRQGREQPDLRYLCANNFPDSLTLRQFRRRHWTLLRDTLARLLAIGAGSVATDRWFDAEAEADLRLEQAAAADSLALDC